MTSFRSVFAVVLLLVVAPAALGSDLVPRSWPDSPVRVDVADRLELERLVREFAPKAIDREMIRPSGDGFEVRLRVSDADLERLRGLGFRVASLPDVEREGRERVEADWRARLETVEKRVLPSFPLTVYPTHSEVGTILGEIAALRPDLARTFEWGLSGNGKKLWGLVVSDSVDTERAEPEVRLAAGIHGDEPVDMVLLLNFAHELVTNYGIAGHEDLTALVDDHEIHFMPLINPDGYIAGTRYNASGYDLNRNFPEPAGQQSVRQVETLAFMDYALSQHFVLSQSGHGGALVVNYPWDYTYTRAPDDAALIALSLEYSTENLPMYNGVFSQGITNGADWYVTTGCLQDWSYDRTDCIDLTIEVSNQKWPSSSSLPTYWGDNRQSLIDLVTAARYGVHGVVTDAHDGAPIAATITVSGNAMSVSTDPDHGDYYKLLPTGSHTLTFAAEGYESQTLFNVQTVWGTPTRIDVGLVPIGVDAPVVRQPLRLEVAPNPFNPVTEVRFDLARAQSVRLTLLDARGRRVRTLLAGAVDAGSHRVAWDGRDDQGRAAGSGVYFVQLRTESALRTAKALLVE